MKAKQSIYIIEMTDKTWHVFNTRADLTQHLMTVDQKKIEHIYRAVPMAFKKQTVTRLVAVRPEAEGANGGGQDDPKAAT